MEKWSARRRETAKKLFGRALRVGLAGWIAERSGEPFYLQEAQDAMRTHLGEAASGVGQELELFCRFGMLTRHPDGRRVYFVANVKSELWEPLIGAARALHAWEHGSITNPSPTAPAASSPPDRRS